MDTLQGKVVVVTGGASGIGRALAHAVAARGAHPVLADVEASALDAAAAEIPGALAVRTDVSDLASVEALRDAVLGRHGRVDVLANIAGVSTFNAIVDQTMDDWRWVLGVNLWGPINTVHTFLPVMRAQGTPAHIVNTASVAGILSGVAFIGPYAVSKVGVVSLSETLRQEVAIAGDPIGVSVLCPSATNTQMMEAERNRPAGMAPEARTEMAEGWRAAIGAQMTSDVGKEPGEVAAAVVDAILTDRFWVITHSDLTPAFEARFAEIMANAPRDDAPRDAAPREDAPREEQ
jgi:NAD(P)-dependent dehydrogenase (short-subunit alcohol dehydrogenase family)